MLALCRQSRLRCLNEAHVYFDISLQLIGSQESLLIIDRLRILC